MLERPDAAGGDDGNAGRVCDRARPGEVRTLLGAVAPDVRVDDGVAGVIVGRALYTGAVGLSEALASGAG